MNILLKIDDNGQDLAAVLKLLREHGFAAHQVTDDQQDVNGALRQSEQEQRCRDIRAEEELQRSNELLRAVIEAAPTAIIGLDLDGNVRHVWNPAAEKLLGWAAGEVMGRPLPSVPVESLEEFRRFREWIRSGGSMDGVEVRRQRRDGTPIDYSIFASPLRDGEGRITGNIAVLVDIGERKQMEEALRESENRYRLIVETADEGIWQVDREWRTTYVNRRMEQMLGCERGAMRGHHIFDFMDEEGCRAAVNLMSHRERGVRETHDFRFFSRDGSCLDTLVCASPLFDELGEFAGAIAMVTDITRRKEAEAALRESEEKFRVLAETSPTAIFLYQGEMIVYANPATERLFGYAGEELLRMRFWDWAHDDYKETVRVRGLARQREGAVSGCYESRFVTKKGEDRWLVVSAGPIEFQGKPAGVASFLDITESKRNEELLRVSLAEKVVLLKEVHHRVKNNLQIISTLLDLQSEPMKDREALSAFRESQDRIKAMALIHERLYTSEDFASVDFENYIGILSAHLVESYLVDPGRITLDVYANSISIGIDRAIPCGLIINELVSNALKHAFPDNRPGKIAIRFHADEDDWLTLTVADTGVGLPPGLDLHNTGTLGLQLVNMLTSQLGGNLSVGSGAGAVFSIRFRWSRPS